MPRPESRAEALLYELSIRGYCFPLREQEALIAEIPDDPDEFVARVLALECRSPLLIKKDELRRLRSMICDWLYASDGRGARSGLP